MNAPSASDVPPPWSADDEWLECVQMFDETHDVRTFVLRATEPRSFRFRSGQYMTYGLQTADGEIQRCYTIASAPTRPDRLHITCKRVPGGPSSNWLHEHLRPGVRLAARGPGGDFSCFGHADRPAGSVPLLFLSGGSGITPLMSMARTFHDLGQDIDLVFVHAARTPADVIFGGELAVIAQHLPRFRVGIICEQRGKVAAYAGMLGRLNLGLLQATVPDFLQRDVYCCGPAPFMAAARSMLTAAGFDMARYREESFSFESVADAAPVLPPASTEAALDFEVRFAKRGDVFRCSSEQTVLQAASAAGLRVPFSCSQGLCGTCRTLKISGEVEMNDQGGLRPREIRQGWVLPCCSRPKSDLVLDR
jgi:ferredoxin-NADP reductase